MQHNITLAIWGHQHAEPVGRQQRKMTEEW
jgi:hypothetical protein